MTHTHTCRYSKTEQQFTALRKSKTGGKSSQPRGPATQKGNSSDCPDPTKEKSSGSTQQPRKHKQIDASTKKKAELEASSIAARQLFERSKVQSLEEEVSKLKQQQYGKLMRYTYLSSTILHTYR